MNMRAQPQLFAVAGAVLIGCASFGGCSASVDAAPTAPATPINLVESGGLARAQASDDIRAVTALVDWAAIEPAAVIEGF